MNLRTGRQKIAGESSDAGRVDTAAHRDRRALSAQPVADRQRKEYDGPIHVRSRFTKTDLVFDFRRPVTADRERAVGDREFVSGRQTLNIAKDRRREILIQAKREIVAGGSFVQLV